MWAGDNVLALVWSFTNDLQDIPYRIEYSAKKYSCTCPAFTHRRNCKHLTAFRDGMKANTLHNDSRFNLTDNGKDFLVKK